MQLPELEAMFPTSQIALNYLEIIPSFAWHLEVFGSLRKWLYLSTSDIDMDQQWMYKADRRTKEFIDGLHYFLNVAETNKQNGFMCCLCSSRTTLHNHIFCHGFMPKYLCWTKHGEKGVMMEDNEEVDYDDAQIPIHADSVPLMMILLW